MITKSYELIFLFVAGFFLGSFFFAGLWWSVTKLLPRKDGGIYFGLSALVRFAVVLVGFYFIAAHGLAGVFTALGGFLVARLCTHFLVRRVVSRLRVPGISRSAKLSALKSSEVPYAN